MKRHLDVVALVLLGLAASGCGGGAANLLGGGLPTPESAAPVNSNLAMPPDMQLRAPGTAPRAVAASPDIPGHPYQSNNTVAMTQPPAAAPQSVAMASPAPLAPQPQLDVFERNGISKVHPDGKPKTKGELNAELKKVLLAKKRQQNPNYGTIMNIGNIFEDG